MPLKHLMFATALQTVTATCADRWMRRFTLGRGVILMFHSVRPHGAGDFAPNRGLEITPEFLDCVLTELRREGFDIVPLDAIPSRLASNSSRPFAALTFDDGYRDNVEHAWPVLKRHGAPWTMFVTTDFAEGKGHLWWVELEQAIVRLDRVRLRDQQALDLPTRTAAQKQTVFALLYHRLRAASEVRLRTAMAALSAQANVNGQQLVRDLCLGWDELRTLACEPDITIGAHTLSHSVLAKQDMAATIREIGGSRTLLERQLGGSIRHFAYPFGDRSAAGAREFSIARQAGFDSAVTSRPGHIFSDHASQLYALPRVSINGLFQSKSALRALLSGVPFLAWNAGRVAPIEA
jgi:peptidoglycan/xylan/chitin deacetylase (PgdA/CDA1 family)